MPLQVGYCSHGCTMNVISEIIHTANLSHIRYKRIPSKQATGWGSTVLFGMYCYSTRSYQNKRKFVQKYIQLHSLSCAEASLGSGFTKAKQELYTDVFLLTVCRSCLQMSLRLDKCQISRALHVVEFYWYYWMRAKQPWWVFIVDEATRRGENSALSRQNLRHSKPWSVFAQHTTLEIQVVSCMLLSVEFALSFGTFKGNVPLTKDM